MPFYALVLVVVATISTTSCYVQYVSKIPNGGGFAQYPALGHPDAAGIQGENLFGKDYRSAGGTWKGLCPMDSDNDQLTNGQELGDPCCLWTGTADNSKLIKQGISHPSLPEQKTTNPVLVNPDCPGGVIPGKNGAGLAPGIPTDDDEDDSSESAPILNANSASVAQYSLAMSITVLLLGVGILDMLHA